MISNHWEERRYAGTHRAGDDVRNEWERDYARLIHSAAFRRLQSKTQVLGLGESDFYRTRLTHSMEVSQIGTGIVRWLKEKHKDNEEITSVLPSSALMSAICLAHDIGHPPFGHGGEVALNVCMRDFGGFEGNGQTLRILSKLDKYTECHGMNPTRRMLLGVLKYPVPYSEAVKENVYGSMPPQKWLSKAREQKPPKCYLDDERDVVAWILDPFCDAERETFTTAFDEESSKHRKPKHKGLDTSIMELADDISYSLHDLEDAVSLGLIARKDWRKHFQDEKYSFRFSECGLDLDEYTDRIFSETSYVRKKAIGSLVHKCITNISISSSGMEGAQDCLLSSNAVMDEAVKHLMDGIFDLVKEKVIKSPNVQQLEFKGQKLVMELFQALASDPDRLLPRSTMERYGKAGSSIAKMRVICDYVSGMTDDYATRMYEKIYYPHKGSIFDRL
jgi:dGTPase